eukprot:maker-scaffold22_size673200-snap-gene-4.23 protein:Tk12689 transcript:maker-scaffold22_size673200-snap-gene-4.23-mRNA-1 annotation:"niemann-pick c1 protein isoform x3"
MNRIIVLFYVLARALPVALGGQCLWYDECGIDPGTGKNLNCQYDGLPKPLPADIRVVLDEHCPYYENTELFCCSPTQVQNMVNGFGVIASLLGRCPSCLHNFKKAFCDMSCSPDQSDFMKVTKTVEVRGYDNESISLVHEVDFHLDKEFGIQVYDSCKDVVNPSTSGSVLELMCGSWGSLCTAQRFFTYLGNPANQNTPIRINFYLESEPHHEGGKLYNRSTIHCDEAPPNGDGACSCTDCERACQSPDFGQVYHLSDEDSENYFDLWLLLGCLGIFFLSMGVFIGCLWMRHRTKIYPMMASGDKKTKAAASCGTQTLNKFMFDQFYRWGLMCARHAAKIMALGFALVLVASGGIFFIEVETDPVRLWSAPTSRSRVEKDFFETAFEPFFRVEQIILKPKKNDPFMYRNLFEDDIQMGAVFRPEFMLETLRLLKEVQALTTSSGVSLSDICHKPLAPDQQECNIQSIWAYWQDDPDKFLESGINPTTGHNDTYIDHFLMCSNNPTLQQDQTFMKQGCMSKGGVPVQPVFVLGGFDLSKSNASQGSQQFSNPTALIVTILVNNHPNDTHLAMDWEKTFVEFMNAQLEEGSDLMEITFNSERSIQDELERSSLGDIAVVLISYSTMLVYIMVSLGKIYSKSTFFVDIKITLSLIGTLGVLLAIASAIGTLGYLGLPTTLIIFQILPFLILAVGVDNIFILVNTVQSILEEDSTKDVKEIIALAVAKVGPSILMSTVAQVTAFLLGGISDMPAVRSFSIYAAMALAWNFVLQMTIFIGALYWDLYRQCALRADIFCCLQRSPREEPLDGDFRPGSWFQRLWTELYVPFLFNQVVRKMVVVVFAAWTCASIWLIPHIRVGLEQEVAMPDDSQVLRYFNALKSDLSVGPPVYFVVNRTRPDSPFDFSLEASQDKICGGRGCNSDGLQAQIKLWSKEPRITRIATPAQSWIDDFFSWAKYCCQHDGLGQPCEQSDSAYSQYGEYSEYGTYGEEAEESAPCTPCITKGDRPEPSLFGTLVPRFLAQNPDESCPKAGKAAYRHALHLSPGEGESVQVEASSFFAFHSVLRDSNDFTEALRWSRRLADNLTSMLNSGDQHVRVFPYSIFYVFYEQYLTMWSDTLISLAVAVVAVFLVVLAFTGLDVFSAVAIMVTILVTLVNMGGVMVILGIDLNAISLVNLVMTVGVGVEFSSHLVQAFRSYTDEPSGLVRSRKALVEWGPTILAGVHLTNAIGVVVLALSRSQIFHIYFFQMYMSIVILGMLHGLVLLPVILTFWGLDQPEKG